MGKCIYKVDDNGAERFIVWSSVVDAPVTFALTEKEIEGWVTCPKCRERIDAQRAAARERTSR